MGQLPGGERLAAAARLSSLRQGTLDVMRKPLYACIAVMVATGAGCHPLRERKGQPQSTLLVVVTAAGETRKATIRCGHGNTGTGYLAALNNSSSACITALISWPAIHYLEDGKAPFGEECQPRGEAPLGATASIDGVWIGKPLHRRIVVRTRCDAALWTFLGPMFNPADAPLVVSQSDLSGRENRTTGASPMNAEPSSATQAHGRVGHRARVMLSAIRGMPDALNAAPDACASAHDLGPNRLLRQAECRASMNDPWSERGEAENRCSEGVVGSYR
ncbi:MAG: hypothetical protein QOJ29_1741 [Thermoleophilaceae bacterium]|jgi:hypothetical protein|nr:hypothetical protein [Thermoleophilaceae bacterium]